MQAFGLTLLSLAGVAMADNPVDVRVNGSEVNFLNALPQMIDGRVLVPLRGVFEQMGATVGWEPASQTVIADGNGRHIRIQIGSHDANVNGKVMELDVPPQIMEDTTMVPLRFLGEALGARVDWQPQNNLVAITTNWRHGDDDHRAQQIASPPPPPPPANAPRAEVHTVVISRNTVLPLRLDETLSSNGNQAGDHFTATIRGDSGQYFEYPDGTVVEGVVRSARPASGPNGGSLDVRFTHIKFPDGSRYPLSGYVARLDDKRISKSGNGRFVASSSNGDSVKQGAEIGAGAGLLLGSFKGRALGGAVIGGALGAIVGALGGQHGQNVTIPQDTRLGLVLNRDLTVDRHDLQ
jgi:hypothetical protein